MSYRTSITETGLIIKSQEYQQNKRVISFFTQKGELITLFTIYSAKKWQQLSYLIPLTQVEVTYFPSKNSDCFYLQEATILSQTDLYQQTFGYIEVIGKIAATILYSQMPGKTSPLLYALCISYTNYLPKSSDPYTLLCSFYLKLLRYEGLIDFSISCQAISHANFSVKELKQVYRLGYAKEFIHIVDPVTIELKNKIFTLFDSLFYE
ncbi:MAG: hypothetical protein ACRCSV_05075 [Chlamydiales bacterium]